MCFVICVTNLQKTNWTEFILLAILTFQLINFIIDLMIFNIFYLTCKIVCDLIRNEHF